MSGKNISKKKIAVKNFEEMFKTFGSAISEIFEDPKLKEKAKELGESVVEAAETFGSRFKDEDVRDKFVDMGKAAQDFGDSVVDCFKGEKAKEAVEDEKEKRTR